MTATPDLHRPAQPAAHPGPAAAPTVETHDLVVSLGTDHHHFDRLVEWIEEYLRRRPELDVLVQHGFTRAPEEARTVERMPREQLLRLYRACSVVVVQGGPGSILDAREVGAVPIAVPRLSALDEVVDDHQVQFTRVMDRNGEAVMVQSREELFARLDAALADPQSLRREPRVAPSEQASARISQAIPPVLDAPGPGAAGFLRRAGQVARSVLAGSSLASRLRAGASLGPGQGK